jgi:RimJ/RimL family protein N-acetyltransferase
MGQGWSPGADEQRLPIDGGLALRLIRSDDAPRLIALHERLSLHTAYQRFFAAMRRLPPDWANYLANVDYHTRLALVLERASDDGPELVGVARYEPTAEADTVEVAFVVQDGWQGKGLGKILFRELIAAATARGIRRFRAYVLADNTRMLRLLSAHSRILERHTAAGVTELLFEALR